MNQHNDIPQLKVLGPDCVEEWTDLYHVDDLCPRCKITLKELDEVEEASWPYDLDSIEETKEVDEADVSERWESESIESNSMQSSDGNIVLWTDENGPTLGELRRTAHQGCHFCTIIISHFLVKRRNMRLTAEEEGTLGNNRRSQDMLYENDRVHLMLLNNPLGIKGRLIGGVRIWCADGDRGATDLQENVEDASRLESRVTLRKGVHGRDRFIREYCHDLATFSFESIEDPQTLPPVYVEQTDQNDLVSDPSAMELRCTGGEDLPEEDEVFDSRIFPKVSVRQKEIPSVRAAQQGPLDEPSVWMSAEEIASHWLEDCLKHHDCGHKGSIDPALPLRVVDVQGRGGKADPFLVQTQGECAKYVTLSYQWGQSRRLMTTSQTVKERHHSIPLTQMPQTFRDAVTLTRKLGIQYLWIDALCILQNSEQDCLQQLSSVADIYNNSTLTIAAVGSLNADDGCTPCRNKLAMCDCRLPKRKTTTRDAFPKTSLLNSGSLHQRAWCFQETEIAPRLLSVGLDQLYWQCKKGLRRECEPAIMIDAYDDKFRERRPEDSWHINPWPLRNRFFDEAALRDPLQAYTRWFWLIDLYADRLLTFPVDKLPAISALAKKFIDLFEIAESKPQPGDYCCGIWLQDLLPGLLWRVKETLWPWRRIIPGPFRAPSWSWAACYNEVSFEIDVYPRPKMSFHATVLDVTVELASKTMPFGAVRSGKLTLLGPVAPLPEACYHHPLVRRTRRNIRRHQSRLGPGEAVDLQEQGSPIEDSIYSNGESVVLGGNGSDFESVNSQPAPVGKSEGFNVEFSPSTAQEILDATTRRDRSLSSKDSSRRSSSDSHGRSSSPHSVDESQDIWISDHGSWKNVCWDSDDLPPTNDCKIIRITDTHAIMICPIRKPGTVGTDKGCCGGIYQRVGLIDAGFRGGVPSVRELDKLRAVFESLDWKNEVVTII